MHGKADFSPPLNFYINELTIHLCIIAMFPWLLFLGLVSRACLKCSSARLVFKGSGVNGQVPTRLEIATRLARELGHQIGYYL